MINRTGGSNLSTPESQRAELDRQRRTVDFDTYDITVDELLRRVERGRLDVAPAYQRKFRWDQHRQSTLIESIYLDIPIPPLFLAANNEAGQANYWEVVDGLQRVTTLVNFAGSEDARNRVGLEPDKPLKLDDLKKLANFNGHTFANLPTDLRTLFEDRPIKVIVLNDKSDARVRFDLFERINTGGIKLTPQEVRECVFRGEFIIMLEELAQREVFDIVVKLPQNSQNDSTREEYILRFFTYFDRYQQFDHAVKEFLDNYTLDRVNDPDIDRKTVLFEKTFEFLAHCFPDGIQSRKKQTPVNLFEGLSVGAALALQINPKIKPPIDLSWVMGEELKQYVSGATNTRNRVTGRIEYCRDKFLGK
ncbi:Protein of unknown function DUF262 [Amycolatopsis lurida]|uniref:DUF262 domain-containing protein n=1 Tax=Amycolatopsis lurida TaxID=31959 RepID=UPI00089A47EC|nr:DUF262 domain-containing protein [Amycolatopsis lurida]SED50531.1 Protein of unknown function DUF262 [Amycolatopsis lurida]